MTERFPAIVLGGGITGLAAGMASNVPVFEACEVPGGICSSYYVRPGESQRLFAVPADGNAYRFEIGGGHWIFGSDPVVKDLLSRLAPLDSFARKSSVFFPEQNKYVPYPLQNNLNHLDREMGVRALAEMASRKGGGRTMREWLEANFGPTLCELFFHPFHALYTAGLYETIAPQDAYKSPIDIREAVRGLVDEPGAAGYNVRFVYPRGGLNQLASELASRADVRYGKKAVRIRLQEKCVDFSDGSQIAYERLLSTLPLNHTLEMAGLGGELPSDPYTSVLVLNIGATRGPRMPDDHWLYLANTRSGFHRVGIYSNVDASFVPQGRGRETASFYIERAYLGGQRPSDADVQAYTAQVVEELQSWGYIGETEVVDPTWIDVAYTWQRPGSKWVKSGMSRLEEHQVFPVGRYARWVFQGIADSIRDGLFAGAAFARGAQP